VGKKLRSFFFSLLLLSFLHTSAQDTVYARTIVNKLTSKEFAGRGYVNEGLHKAADFLSAQFDSLHLQKFNDSYSQKFSFDVNTFPGKVELKINGKAFIPGKDFIVEAISGKGKGEYTVETIKGAPKTKEERLKWFETDYKNKIWLIDIQNPDKEDKDFINGLKSWQAAYPGPVEPEAILFKTYNKLTMDIEGMAHDYPILDVKAEALPDKIKRVSFDVENKLQKDFPAANLVGYVKGTTQPDTFLVISAHYDHLGMMGQNVYFPGANDNASGVSLLLNLATHYATHPAKYSVAFIAFAGEEVGLLGSDYYTQHPLFPLSKIKFLINLDLLGTGEEGMMTVNATEFPQQFHLLDSINTDKKYLVKLGQRGKAKNSDHYWFTEKGVPSFFFYTMGGIQAYHDINDKAETLPLTEFADVFRLIVDFHEAISK
jgi:aminopeptidase YwaD